MQATVLGVTKTKKGKSNSWDNKTEEEKAAIIARADATAEEIWAMDAAKTTEDVSKTLMEDTTSQPAEPAIATNSGLLLSKGDEQTLELASITELFGYVLSWFLECFHWVSSL